MPPIALWRLGQLLIAGAALALTHKLTRDAMKREKSAAPPPAPPAKPSHQGPPVA